MKYYQISLDPEPKIIGIKNGIYQVEINKEELLNHKEYQKFFSFFKVANIDFWKNQQLINNLEKPSLKGKILKSARITDLMGYTPKISFLDYLYSSKYIEVIKKFILPEYNLFEVDVDTIEEHYYMMFLKTIVLEEINYERSVIHTGNSLQNNIKYYTVGNFQEYRALQDSNPLIKFEKISIPVKYSKFDLLSIQPSGYNFYSGRLLNEMLNNCITGIQYKSSIELEFY